MHYLPTERPTTRATALYPKTYEHALTIPFTKYNGTFICETNYRSNITPISTCLPRCVLLVESLCWCRLLLGGFVKNVRIPTSGTLEKLSELVTNNSKMETN